MQKYVRFRNISKVVGWFHLIFAIVGLIHSILLIGFVLLVLVNPSILDNFDLETREILYNDIQHGLVGLIYYVLGFVAACIDLWIQKDLINATNMETSISDALPLAKRWRLWFIFITVWYAGIGFIFNHYSKAIIITLYVFTINGLFCYLVHRYIKSLEENQHADFGSALENV